MEFDTFQSKIIDLRNRKPVWFGLESDPRADDSQVVDAELDLGASLPNCYREFVREFGGGYFAFGNVFSVNPDSEWNIVRRNESISIRGFVAVSDNGTGDYYGFKIKDGICQDEVYFWDHEEPDSLKATRYGDLLEFLDSIALSPS